MRPLSRDEMLAFLRKALAAERTGGFRDRAVIGGLSRLERTVREWESARGQRLRLPGHFLEFLRGYGGTPLETRQATLPVLERLLAEGPGDVSGEPSEPGSHYPEHPEPAEGQAQGNRNYTGADHPGLFEGQAQGEPAEGEPPPAPVTLSSPVTALKGVKQQRAALLERLGVRTAGDLAWLIPVRHEDRSLLTPLAKVHAGVTVTVRARVARAKRVSAGLRKERLEARLQDATGGIDAVWFNQPWMAKLLTPGTEAIFHGPVRERDGRLEMATSEFDLVRRDPGTRTVTRTQSRERETQTPGEFGLRYVSPDLPRLVPIYPLTAGLFQKTLRGMVGEALRLVPGGLPETLPAGLTSRLALIGPAEALVGVHRPASEQALLQAWRRLRFEELFYLELAVAVKRHLFTKARAGVAVQDGGGLFERLIASLPFSLTAAQRRAIDVILADLRSPHAMARLVQGDVGSGKTVVALGAMMAAAGGGWQSALMAPTEILAGQHYLSMRRICGELGVGVELLTGSQTARERREALRAIASGASAIAVGTHALVEGGVEFSRLGLAVVDEQHRFGVNQRSRLKLKGDNPNLLVMTATPIPRTLALTLYGDLEVSVLDELPPGRQPIRTKALALERMETVYEHIRAEAASGRQAYVVCPLIEESEKLEAEAAAATFEEVREKWLPGLRVLLLHGRMPGAEKARVMEAMRSHEADVLVSTTVVEVGVDIPNATVMAVLNAERFGLAQLHQLRGRIGRGSHPSAFYPVLASKSREARARMKVLEASSDGFLVAEKDLELRGPGELFGTRQAGLPGLRAASLPRDLAVLEAARREAFGIVERDPRLQAPELRQTRAELMRRYGEFVHRRH